MFDEIRQYLDKMKEDGVQHTVTTFASLLYVCKAAKGKAWKFSQTLWKDLSPIIDPQLIHYTIMIAVCGYSRHPKEGEMYFKE